MSKSTRAALAVAALTAVAGCAPTDTTQAPVIFAGTQPGASTVTTGVASGADARGIITYPDHQVVLARAGDTVATIAQRIGADAGELARYNGLSPDYRPNAGDVLVLPPRPDRYGAGAVAATPAPGGVGWSPELAAAAIARAEQGGGTQAVPQPQPAAVPPVATGPISSAPVGDPSQPRGDIQPVRHVVGAGETVFSIARLYDVSVTEISDWNGMGASLVVSPGDVIWVPISLGAPVAAAPAPVTSTPIAAAPVVATPVAAAPAPGSTPPPPRPDTIAQPGDRVAVTPPPSAADPLPEPVAAAPAVPESPALSSARAESGATFLRPVPGGVLRPYSAQPGSNRNDGIDFEAAPGQDVVAADDGEVIYVARSVGSFDNIVMIRHPNDIVTAYGRLGAVSVSRGDRIGRGQVIGQVAENSPASVQFQVLRNMAPVDPAPYL